IATGVLAALNSDRLSRISYWFFNVRNYVKSEAQERALLEQRTPFKECRDCPEMIFVSSGAFRRGGPLLGSSITSSARGGRKLCSQPLVVRNHRARRG